MSELDRELEAFENMRAELETHHLRKWVVIRGAELVGSFDTLNTAAMEAVRRFGRGPYLIRQVGAPPASLPASVLYRPVRSHADR